MQGENIVHAEFWDIFKNQIYDFEWTFSSREISLKRPFHNAVSCWTNLDQSEFKNLSEYTGFMMCVSLISSWQMCYQSTALNEYDCLELLQFR